MVAKLYNVNYDGPEGLWCVGINALGFELDPKGGRSGYHSPDRDQLARAREQGANCFRMPITWERLQAHLGSGTLQPVAGVTDTVDFITGQLGARVIIAPHNGADGLRYGGENARRSQFVNLWEAIAREWGGNSGAIFGLYNAPRHGNAMGEDDFFDPDSPDYEGEGVEEWRQWCQEAVLRIRATGSANLILVSGLRWTTTVEWTGASPWGDEFRWGEDIDGAVRAGNTRLAAVEDPARFLAYDVHQYIDNTFGSLIPETSFEAAHQGLPLTVEWARRYDKRLMMTEIGLFGDSERADASERAMRDYLESLSSSGVFLGYQVWDRSPDRLSWHRFGDFGSPGWTRGADLPSSPAEGCAEAGQDCSLKACCSRAAACFQKDAYWAQCMLECVPGVHQEDPEQFRTPWNCAKLH